MNLSERTLQPKGAQIPQNFRSHLKILVARMVTSNKFHIEEPQILDATIKKFSRHGDAVHGIWAPL